MLSFVLEAAAEEAAANPNANYYPYKEGVGSGVSFGEGHALAVPTWFLLLVLVLFMGFLAYFVRSILKMDQERSTVLPPPHTHLHLTTSPLISSHSVVVCSHVLIIR